MLDDTEMHALYDRDWSLFAQLDRVDETVEFGRTSFSDVASMADLSAGGTPITQLIGDHFGVEPLLGDWGPYGYPLRGTLQETLPQIPRVDLFVCSETLEHLDDPDADLRLIRQRCRNLLLTAPVCMHETEEHPEVLEQSDFHGHLWVWKREDVEGMLADAGFEIVRFHQHSLWGMWACR
jgi:hypothetical protein